MTITKKEMAETIIKALYNVKEIKPGSYLERRVRRFARRRRDILEYDYLKAVKVLAQLGR